MTEAYIVDAVRTPAGRRNGSLAGTHPTDLGAAIINGLLDRTGIDPALVDDVIVGCVTQAGEQGMTLGRHAVLASNLPQSVPAVTIDRQCGSSQQAIHFAAQAVMSGTQDVVMAAGIENMSRVPMFSNFMLHRQAGMGEGPVSPALQKKYGVQEFSQFIGAQMMADKYGFSREEMDAFALRSHQKAAAAIQSGAFEKEIVSVQTESGLFSQDEGVRYDASMEGMASVRTLQEGGSITAANASQISDGASAALIVNERALKEFGLTPKARIHNLTVTAGDPVIMLEEPLAATRKALERAGLKLEDIDLFEVNEAFAAVPMAWLKALGADPEKLNVNGGAIALGHPLGASGAKLMATLVHALHARGKRWGLQTMCEGGGIANVTIIEAL